MLELNLYVVLSVITDHITKILQAQHMCCPVRHHCSYYENTTGTTYMLSCPSPLIILRKYYRHNIYAVLSVTTDHITKILQAQHICCPVRHHWSYYENTIGTKYAVLSVTTDHITKILQAQHTTFYRFHKIFFSVMKFNLCHNPNSFIPISLQLHGINLWLFKLRLFELTEFIFSNFEKN